jgi:hypothetical protein
VKISSSGGGGADVVSSRLAGFGDVLCGRWRRSSLEGGSLIRASACRERGLAKDGEGRVRGDISCGDEAWDSGIGERLGCSPRPEIASRSSSGEGWLSRTLVAGSVR